MYLNVPSLTKLLVNCDRYISDSFKYKSFYLFTTIMRESQGAGTYFLFKRSVGLGEKIEERLMVGWWGGGWGIK